MCLCYISVKKNIFIFSISVIWVDSLGTAPHFSNRWIFLDPYGDVDDNIKHSILDNIPNFYAIITNFKDYRAPLVNLAVFTVAHFLLLI